VQSPEFAFEHVIGNITAAVKSLGVKYRSPSTTTCDVDRYRNNYWPGEYLIDAQGVIRHVDYGEGNYGADEDLIRTLLTSANSDVRVAAVHQRARPHSHAGDQSETYLGADRRSISMEPSRRQREHPLPLPCVDSFASYALSGRWLTKNQQIIAEDRSQLTLNFTATDSISYSMPGTIRVSLNGAYLDTLKVSGYARLYTLLRQKSTPTAS